MSNSNIYENGERQGFVFHRNIRNYFIEKFNEIESDLNNNNMQDEYEYIQRLNEWLTTLILVWDYGFEDITEAKFLEASQKSPFGDFLRHSVTVSIKSSQKKYENGKNNFPVEKFPNGPNIKEWLISTFSDFDPKPKQIYTIAQRAAEQGESSTDFLNFCYDYLCNRGDHKEKIFKMFVKLNIFEEDFLKRFRGTKETSTNISEQTEIPESYMFGGDN